MYKVQGPQTVAGSKVTGRTSCHALAKRTVKETQSVASSVILSMMGKKVYVSGKPSNELGFKLINRVH